ncbi:MAG TPA: site-specific integrase [Polyangiaceae bacterium]|jgi:integrase
MSDQLDLEPVPGIGHRVRLRYGKGLRDRFLIKITDEAAAQRRAQRMRELADMLAAAGHSAEAPIILKKAGAVASEADFVDAARFAEDLCKTSRKAQKALQKRRLTFRQLGEKWTKGELHRDYPDQVKKKRTADHDAARLEHHAYPLLGNKRVSDITLDDIEEVMRKLPEGLSPLTRRNIGHLVARLFKLAVYPLRLISASPVPAGFLPNRGARKALAYLYPDEDRRLLKSPDVPFSFRLLWGFLMREGMREGEALALTWSDLDLKRGAVRLDRNKTDDPRAWALDRSTANALKLYKENMRADAEPGDLVFVDPEGRPHTKFGIAMLLRSHLKAIGLKKERPELFDSTPERRRIRVHDLRGTFVTISLASGRSEAWVSARTGHRSSAMINNYNRVARSFQELGAGTLDPLDVALPELADLRDEEDVSLAHPLGQRVGQELTIQQENRASPRGFEREKWRHDGSRRANFPRKRHTTRHDGSRSGPVWPTVWPT